MSNLIIYISVFIVCLLFVVLYVITRWFLKKRRKYSAQSYDHLAPNDSTHEYCEVNSTYSSKVYSVINRIKKTNLLTKLKTNNVKAIYLVHGTFVGDDPWNIFKLIEETFPRASKTLVQSLKIKTKKKQEQFSKDLGNFTQTHADILKEVTESSIQVENFSWSSANNHQARVIGAFELLIDFKKNNLNDKKILLIGHSHAGQLFSLITIMLNDISKGIYFFNLIQSKLNIDNISMFLKSFSKMKIDIVTLGTPPRYKWDINKNMTLLHFINHRGETPLAGTPFGFVITKDGDYVQQWGLEGSDIPPINNKEKEVNYKLDSYLGIGSNISILKENIRERKRLHNTGHHLLIDYKDNSNVPNFIKTAFGHGCYTRFKYFPFIFEKLYN